MEICVRCKKKKKKCDNVKVPAYIFNIQIIYIFNAAMFLVNTTIQCLAEHGSSFCMTAILQ